MLRYYFCVGDIGFFSDPYPSALLKEYAHRHDVAVVLTNHVSDAVSDDDTWRGGGGGDTACFNVRQRRLFGPAGDLRSSGRAVVPSLGLFWANCVNTRVFLSRSGGSAGGYDGGGGGGGALTGAGGGVRRRAQVVFSSHLPAGGRTSGWADGAARSVGGEVGCAACEFDVREDGVWWGGRGDFLSLLFNFFVFFFFVGSCSNSSRRNSNRSNVCQWFLQRVKCPSHFKMTTV